MNWPGYQVLKWNLLVWVSYFLLVLLLPASSLSQLALYAFLSLASYVLISSLAAVVFASLFRHTDQSGDEQRTRREPLTTQQIRILVIVASALSLLGLLLLIGDRMFVQNIDYSQGLAVARQQWLEAGERRTGISSIASAAGHLLTPLFFSATILAYFHWGKLQPRHRMLALGASLLSAFGVSFLTGGRTVLLMLTAALLIGGVLRRVRRKPFLPGTLFAKSAFIAAVLAILTFSGYVFASRSEAGGFSIRGYTASVAQHLGGEVSEEYYLIPHLVGDDDINSSVAYLGVAVGLYLGHSFWTYERILDEKERRSFVVFAYPVSLLSKTGLVRVSPEPWSQSGYFISLPGGLWYDYGWLGLLLGAVAHGALLGVLIEMLRRRRGGGMATTFTVGLLMITYLAPFIPATELMAFPAMIVAFTLLAGVSRIFFGRRVWLALSS